jgi:demethylspheroidene O-methyltransferase
MSASLPLVATEVLDVYPFHDHRRILDVGGGEGGFLCTIAATVPHVQGVVFDLPAVIPRTRERIARDGLAHRIKTVAGDFLSDPLPRECDLACLTRVLHDHDDETVMQILRAVHAALETGASVLIAEPLSKTRGARPVGDAYFGFYLLAMGRGRPRSAQELGRMLEAAGFVHVRRVPTLLPLQTGLLHAVRP